MASFLPPCDEARPARTRRPFARAAAAAGPSRRGPASSRTVRLAALARQGPDRLAYNDRAAEVLLRVYEGEPTHPGGIHYTIHANDVDARADESLDVVRSYSEIAPAVPHALHMPTHIFVRLGAWPEVIEWNIRSAEAALDFPSGDAISYHYLHAVDYLVYAYLQRGDDRRARSVMEEAMSMGRHQGSFISAWHLAAMPARYAVERRAWDEAATVEPRAVDYLKWDAYYYAYYWPEALSWFARGLGAAHTGDLPAARQAERERPAEALTAYESSLEVWPGRFNTLLGAARAAREADDAATARDYYAELLDVVGDTETERAGVREAREFLGRTASTR